MASSLAFLAASPASPPPQVPLRSSAATGAPQLLAANDAALLAAPEQSSAPAAASGLFLGGFAMALGAFAAQRSGGKRHSAASRGNAAFGGQRRGRIVRQAGAAAGKKLSCVGIVGCSGAVGQEMLKCLESRDFPVEKVRLFAKRSAGTTVKTKFGDIVVEPFSVEAAQACDVCLLAVSGDFSKEFSPKIRGGPKNTIVVDNSSAWRYNEDVPLIVPEINGEKIKGATLVSNPNCTTAVGAMALWPLHQKYTLKSVLMSTYQAASGAGAEGMAELEEGLKAHATTGKVPAPKIFKHQLPFNVIPQIDAFQENGYTKEEMKVNWEIKKIFGLPDVKVSCTSVRVPTFRAHSESIVVETEKKCNPKEALDVLRSAVGVKVVDDPDNFQYPMPLNATGQADVEVGRVRRSLVFGDNGLEFFVSGDQLLRGAALNAVIIAEHVAAERLA